MGDEVREGEERRENGNVELTFVLFVSRNQAGAFPFTLRSLEEEKRARMGVQEAVQHGLLTPYDVV